MLNFITKVVSIQNAIPILPRFGLAIFSFEKDERPGKPVARLFRIGIPA